MHLCRQRGLRNSSHVWRGKLLLAPNVGFLTRGADQLSYNFSLTIDTIQPYWRYNSVVEITCHGVAPIDMSSSYTLHPTSQSYMSEIFILMQCTMVPLSTRSCLKSNKLRPILNGQFCHEISKNICLNVFGSKQPREILFFVIFKL